MDTRIPLVRINSVAYDENDGMAGVENGHYVHHPMMATGCDECPSKTETNRTPPGVHFDVSYENVTFWDSDDQNAFEGQHLLER